MNQSAQTVCRAALGIVERRQVDGSAVEHQVLRLDGVGHGSADALLVGFEQLLCRGYQLFLLRIAMPLVSQLVERVDESAAQPPLVVHLISHLAGDAIGGLETDAPDVIS